LSGFCKKQYNCRRVAFGIFLAKALEQAGRPAGSGVIWALGRTGTFAGFPEALLNDAGEQTTSTDLRLGG
jgi:hypothetical protein